MADPGAAGSLGIAPAELVEERGDLDVPRSSDARHLLANPDRVADVLERERAHGVVEAVVGERPGVVGADVGLNPPLAQNAGRARAPPPKRSPRASRRASGRSPSRPGSAAPPSHRRRAPVRGLAARVHVDGLPAASATPVARRRPRPLPPPAKARPAFRDVSRRCGHRGCSLGLRGRVFSGLTSDLAHPDFDQGRRSSGSPPGGGDRPAHPARAPTSSVRGAAGGSEAAPLLRAAFPRATFVESAPRRQPARSPPADDPGARVAGRDGGTSAVRV